MSPGRVRSLRPSKPSKAPLALRVQTRGPGGQAAPAHRPAHVQCDCLWFLSSTRGPPQGSVPALSSRTFSSQMFWPLLQRRLPHPALGYLLVSYSPAWRDVSSRARHRPTLQHTSVYGRLSHCMSFPGLP